MVTVMDNYEYEITNNETKLFANRLVRPHYELLIARLLQKSLISQEYLIFPYKQINPRMSDRDNS